MFSFIHFRLAQIILNLLNYDDEAMIMTISNIIHTIDGQNKFVALNSTMKNHLRKFIDGIERDSAATNHSLVFQYAFEWIASQFNSDALKFDEKSTPLQILYVSRGLISQTTDIRTVLETIAIGQSKLKQPIVINTCAIILGKFWFFNFLFKKFKATEKKTKQHKFHRMSLSLFLYMYTDEKSGAMAKEFLSDIAHQNYAKYGIDVNDSTSNAWFKHLNNYNQNGNLFIVNHRNINEMYAVATAAITDIWFEKPFLKSQIIVHQPFYDQTVKGMLQCFRHRFLQFVLF